MARPATAKKGTAKVAARTEKGRTTKAAAGHAKGQKPTKKTELGTGTTERVVQSPTDARSVLNDLIAESQSQDEQVSLGAIDRLRSIEDPRATLCLVSCLKDPRYIVRIYAAAQLGERKDVSAVESLIEALHDESVFVRQTVAGALEHIGGERALRAVKKAQTDGLLLDELPEGRRLGPPPED